MHDQNENHTLPHGALADALVDELDARGLGVAGESWAVSRTGAELYGSVDVAPEDPAVEVGLSIGLRHSNARRHAVTLVLGGRVFVCANGMLVGDYVLRHKHKHTARLDVREMVAAGVSLLIRERRRVDDFVQDLRSVDLDDAAANHLLLEGVRRGVVPWSQLRRVDETWRHPPHTTFEPRTLWSLYNAFTEVLKTRSPAVQYRGLLRLRRLAIDVLARQDAVRVNENETGVHRI